MFIDFVDVVVVVGHIKYISFTILIIVSGENFSVFWKDNQQKNLGLLNPSVSILFQVHM